MEALKDFVRTVAYAIDGIYGDPEGCEKTVLQYWKDFTAGWRRQNPVIPPKTTLSISNVSNLRLLQVGLL